MDSSSEEDMTSSEGCTESSSEDESELFETAKIMDLTLQMPQGLCENQEIFDEFFSMRNMSAIFEKNRGHLSKFLPNFEENDRQEKDKTLKMLFGGENFRFGNPVESFRGKLRAGDFRPDIAKMKGLMKILKKRDQKFREKKHFEGLLTDLVVSRQKLLDVSYTLPPGAEPPLPKNEIKVNPILQRTKRRYFHEISCINKLVGEISDFSDDENYPEGPPKKPKIDQKSKEKIFYTFQNSDFFIQNSDFAPKNSEFSPNDFFHSQISDENLKKTLKHFKKSKNASPEYDFRGLNLKDIAMRAQYFPKKGDRSLKIEPKPNKPKEKPKKIEVKVEKNIENREVSSEFSDDSFIEVENRVKPKPKPKVEVVPEVPKVKKVAPVATVPTNLPPIAKYPEVKEEIVEETPPTISIPQDGVIGYNGKLIPATLSDLEGIDMMNLPVDLDEGNIDILEDINIKPELMQETHGSFFSLVRDIICSTMEHRMSLGKLEERLKEWQENPISPLNDWYSHCENWGSLLGSALGFLCGEAVELPVDFVPYIEYKPLLQVYQWIGAGRDSDNLMVPLCNFWFEHKEEGGAPGPVEMEVDVVEKEKAMTPPPPRWPTTWSVRKASPEEVTEFRRQEKERYSNPHKAYTYKMYGYQSTVGPVKGIYSHQGHQGGQKARGHSMLNADRPNYVTILTLVRDATARLPNGEGTRADICELLKSSQYISSAAPDNVLQSVVSGALDRMHTEYDPCVKYDSKRKTWIYLHRNRTEADFERIHQQSQGMSKHLKKNNRKKPKPQNKEKDKEKVEKVTPKTSEKKSFKTPVSRVFTIPTVQTIQTTPPDKKQTTPTPTKTTNTPLKQINQDIESALPVNLLENKNELILNENKIVATASTASVGGVVNPAPVGGAMTSSTVNVINPAPMGVSTTSNKSLIKIINQNKNSQNQTVFIKQIDKKLSQNVLLNSQNSSNNQGSQSSQIGIQKLNKNITKPVIKKDEILTTVGQVPIQVQVSQVNQIGQNSQNSNQNLITTNISKNTILMTNQSKLLEIKQKALNSSSNQSNSQNSQITQIGQVGNQNVVQAQVASQNVVQASSLQSSQNVLTVQQAILKQQSSQKIQGQVKGQSLLGQQRFITQVTSPKTIPTQAQQTPLVAKVLTNSAGQVISVESLLAHQKQHGTLPQGTTLRVSGKPGQPNLIQIASNSGPVAQFAVVSQNNLVSLNQKVITTLAPSTAGVKPIQKTSNTLKPSTKIVTSKLGGGFVNAKIIQQKNPQKINLGAVKVGQKAVGVGQLVKPGVRMVNAGNLNLAHIGGKPVLFAKGSGLGQNVLIQTTPTTPTPTGAGINVSVATPTGAGLNVTTATPGASSTTPNLTTPTNSNLTVNFAPETVKTLTSVSSGISGGLVLGGQLKLQNAVSPLVVKQAGLCSNTQNAVVLSGLKVQNPNQRVVLASQGQGGQLVAQQILIPPNFQGGAINIKTLQGLKVIPLASQQQQKGRPQQVFARIMNPGQATRVAQLTTTNIQQTTSNQQSISDNNQSNQSQTE